MDVLLPVFVAVLLAEAGGRVQAIGHALHIKFPDNTATIVSTLVFTSFVSLTIAAIGGAIVATMIDFRARTLLTGLALAFAGLPLLVAGKPADIAGTRPFTASLRAFAPAQLGDASQFIVFAMAARGGAPVLALMAGMAALLAATAAPLLAAEWPGKVPVHAIRKASAISLILGGLAFAASAFRVI